MTGDDKKPFGEFSLEPIEGDPRDNNPFGERSVQQESTGQTPAKAPDKTAVKRELPDTSGLSLEPLDGKENIFGGKADFSINDREGSDRRVQNDRRSKVRPDSERRSGQSRRT